ncbi:DDE-type integrase/transposase/recombinase [Rhodococcus erythropolis]|uniref:DDE-type integrase/transposase/recombinase n=1 Tax=Rhodococcus erythropolis TaxID=1833 RepID=UPI002948D846|nr:DDE-type integrase/transposase/recombinase [Rhodococcus erythropolis]MDV6278451.1 DDE-type integrase/transposase/recombinase [Rhodococcus erythropolis]
MGDTTRVTCRGAFRRRRRVVDQHGNVLDILIQSRRGGKAVTRFFRNILKKQGCRPRVLVTDKLASYRVAHRNTMSTTEHRHNTYLNNRCENYPSTDPATRTRDERVPDCRLSSTVSGLVQSYLAALPTSSSPYELPPITAPNALPDSRYGIRSPNRPSLPDRWLRTMACCTRKQLHTKQRDSARCSCRDRWWRSARSIPDHVSKEPIPGGSWRRSRCSARSRRRCLSTYRRSVGYRVHPCIDQ